MYRVSIDVRPAAVALAVIVLSLQSPAWAEEKSELRAPEFLSMVPGDGLDFQPPSDATVTPKPGTMEVVRERYPNGSVRVEREVTLDAEGNYVNHGTWKMFAADGTAIAEGQFDMGKRTGAWTRWLNRQDARVLSEPAFRQFKAPFVSQVNYVDGKMDGQWLIIDGNQRQCLQISLSMGKRNGPVTSWLPNGKVARQSTYENGVPVGDVMELNSRTGEVAVSASYVDGRNIVTKTDKYNNRARQTKSQEMYLAATTVELAPDDFWNLTFAEYKSDGIDLLHGSAKTWYDNGKPHSEGFYDYGKKSGTFTYWYPNGQVQASGEYVDDKPTGTWVWWHENGLKSAIGEYRDGYLYGPWRWWSEDGQLAKQRLYDGTEKITSEDAETFDVGQRATDTDEVVR